MKRRAAHLKHWARELVNWLAPGGSRRQLLRFKLTRFIRRLLLPARPRIVSPLPDFNDEAAVGRYLALFSIDGPNVDSGNSDHVYHWLDFHPHVLLKFPLATMLGERDVFIAWLLVHRNRFGIQVGDILALGRELQSDPTGGVEPLFRRRPDLQRAVPSPEGERGARGVNLLAHFCYPCGLQVAAMNTLAAFESAGWAVSCRDVPNRMATDRPNRRRWLGLHPYPVTIVQLAPDRLGRNAYFVAGLDEKANVQRIGYWYWELETVPKAWAKQADWLDEIWAPTRFIGDALRRVMPIPVIDMLPGLPPPPVVEMPRAELSLPSDRFLFLFAFDMSSTGERKNPEAVVAAFKRAFAPHDDVALALKITRGWEDPSRLAALHAVAERERIIVIDRILPERDYFGLLNACDAYISLHRSEGFGLTLAEAMALGKPTIATRYSGNLAFMNDDNSLLVACTMTELRAAAKNYPRGAFWAEPSIDDAVEKMRWVVKQSTAAREMGERGRSFVRANLSLAAAGQRMTKRLLEKPV